MFWQAYIFYTCKIGYYTRKCFVIVKIIFANFTHEPAVKLAQELTKILPNNLTKFHFNDNGSAAVECALKICFQFYLQTGKPKKQRFMCLTDGYHGETIGALAVGGIEPYTFCMVDDDGRKFFVVLHLRAWMPNVFHIQFG